MEEIGYIEIKIDNAYKTLSPKDLDINEVKELILNFEAFLYPTRKERGARPHISYLLGEGSASNKFFLPISGILLFNGLTSEISKRQDLSFLSYKQQEIISNFQKQATDRGLIIELRSSLNPDKPTLVIDKTTDFQINLPQYYEGEFYLYGEIYQNGGKEPNIHIATDEGNITVYATKEQISEGENKLYKTYGIKARGKKSLEDGSYSDLKLLEFITYKPVFNLNLLNKAIEKAMPNLGKIENVDEWIDDLKAEVI